MLSLLDQSVVMIDSYTFRQVKSSEAAVSESRGRLFHHEQFALFMTAFRFIREFMFLSIATKVFDPESECNFSPDVSCIAVARP